MQLKIILFGLLAIAFGNYANAQVWSTVCNNRSQYIIGEGTGETEEEADKMAISNLISQISVNVSVSDVIKNDQTETNGVITSDNNVFQSTIQTVSAAALTNTERIVLSEAPEARVARWIKRSEIDRLFQARRKKFCDMIDASSRALEKGKVDVALRELYWALMLVNSMQYSNEEEYQGNVLVNWIPMRISQILSDVRVNVYKCTDSGADLMFTYQNKPVNSIDFTFNDGGLESYLCSAKDGLGHVDIPPFDGRYDVTVQVAYRDQTDYDPELKLISGLVPDRPFSEAFFKVHVSDGDVAKTQSSATVSEAIPEPAVMTAAAFAEKMATSSFTSVEQDYIQAPPTVSVASAEAKTEVLSTIINAIRNRNIGSVNEYLTTEARDIFRRLIGYGNARIIGEPQFSYSKFGNYTWARGLSMNFSFRNGKRKNFTEDIVFTFDDTQNKICNIAFGLGSTATTDILADKTIPAEARMLLTDFMENYQTAFALKRLDYIKSIFSDDALIIVVNKLANKASSNPELAYESKERYQSIRYDKDSYIDRLSQQFQSKEFINLRFNETTLQPSYASADIYGMQIEQDYYSSNYSDHGYLFLQINMQDPKNPLIIVRTWQPEPDPKFGLYSLDDFKVQKFD